MYDAKPDPLNPNLTPIFGFETFGFELFTFINNLPNYIPFLRKIQLIIKIDFSLQHGLLKSDLYIADKRC